jgi:hypothetical protein
LACAVGCDVYWQGAKCDETNHTPPASAKQTKNGDGRELIRSALPVSSASLPLFVRPVVQGPTVTARTKTLREIPSTSSPTKGKQKRVQLWKQGCVRTTKRHQNDLPTPGTSHG